jgi:serine protease Do
VFFSSEYSIFGGSDTTPWPDVESELNKLLTQFGVGAKVTLVYARDGQRREATVLLESAPLHYKNAPKARHRALGLSVRDMTFEVRRFFKFGEKSPGVVIAKVKPGSPAAVAGLRPFELVTEVNGENVSDAKDFASKIKGRQDLVFAVRRLAQTRMVKIHVEPEAEKEKAK